MLYRVFGFVVCLFLLSGCSTTPEWAPKTVLENTKMFSRVKLDRQRHFQIARDSRIAWRFESNQLSKEGAKPSSEQVSSQLEAVLQERFGEVTTIKGNDPLNWRIDFLFDTVLLDTTGEQDPEAGYDKPHEAKMRLSIIDARSRKVLDVILVEARSGAIGHGSYMDFMSDSFREITQQLVVSH